MELTKKQRLYQSHIKAAEEAGLPLATYAKQQGINAQCLYGEKYRPRRKQSKTESNFVRIQDVAEPMISPMLMQIRLPNGVSMALPFHQAPLVEILQTLAKL
jgi:hypothetical protein|tara:strand:- start:2649 stop:2954 length:306 start_codon:yes stop_codon:yes gene_type:complete